MIRRTALVLTLLTAASAAGAQTPPQPEAPTGRSEKRAATAKRFMVAAAHPEAVRIALDILKRGGNAVDAAVAAQLALNLVEPHGLARKGAHESDRSLALDVCLGDALYGFLDL